MTRLLALFIASACGLCAVAAPVPRERIPPDDKAVKKRFYDCWHEEWREEPDVNVGRRRATKPSELRAYRFGEKEGRSWDWGDQLAPTVAYPVLLDTARTPMRFDKYSMNADGSPSGVVPGVFKFDGPRLILAYPTPGWQRWNASGEYPNRPKDFEPRAGIIIAVLERCEYLEQYRPPERIPEQP